MKKYIMLGVVIVVALPSLCVGGYVLYKKFSIDNNYYYSDKDLTGIAVPEVTFPLKNIVLTVPEVASTTVQLDLVKSTPRHDYPMGRFVSADGVVKGSIFALDDLVTDEYSGRRAVPIAVDLGGSGVFYYLAILAINGDAINHITSLPIGDRVRIEAITENAEQVEVRYLVHDRGQAMSENPRVETTATFDIVNPAILIAGRVPQNEVVVVAKTFAGEYVWRDTVSENGEITIPAKPDVFTLRFDGRRLELGTDCNRGSTSFSVGSGTSTDFTVDGVASTKMFCESMQESDYFSMIESIVSYEEASDGVLTFTLDEGRHMTFVPKKTELEFEGG